jgi:predicted DNA binding CopG/RHH family protein
MNRLENFLENKNLLEKNTNYELVVDIETTTNNKLKREFNKIQAINITELESQKKYTWRDDWKDETNIKKEREWNEKKDERIQKEISKLVNANYATDPFLNKIIIIGAQFTDDSEFLQWYIGDYENEKHMLKDFLAIAKNKTIITYGSFDLFTIKIKCAMHGIEFPKLYTVDILNDLSFWTEFGKVVPNLHKTAISFGLEEKIKTDLLGIDKSSFHLLDPEQNMDIDKNFLYKVLKMNKNDVEITSEIYKKWRLFR